jgi:excisionase family DNA binding protein
MAGRTSAESSDDHLEPVGDNAFSSPGWPTESGSSLAFAGLVLLRPNDVARKLSVSRAWIYEAARTGRIPSVRLGGEDGPLRFIEADLDQWLAEARSKWRPGRRAS